MEKNQHKRSSGASPRKTQTQKNATAGKNSKSFSSWEWIKTHRTTSALLGVVLVLVLIVVAAKGVLFLGDSYNVRTDSLSAPEESDMAYGEAGSVADDADTDGGGPSGIEIRKGSVTATTEDSDEDEEFVRSLVDQYEGYIEEGRRSETNTFLRMRLTARVPAEDFDRFFEDLKDQLDVEDYNIRNFRIEIEQQRTELDIVRETLAMYAAMKEDTQQMMIGEERVNLIMNITDRELDLKRRERQLEQQITDVTRRGDMATVHITLEERLSAEIWPDDLANQFRDSVRDAVQSGADILVAIVTTSFIILLGVIQWIIYALIILVPVWFAFRVLLRVYRRIYGSE